MQIYRENKGKEWKKFVQFKEMQVEVKVNRQWMNNYKQISKFLNQMEWIGICQYNAIIIKLNSRSHDSDHDNMMHVVQLSGNQLYSWLQATASKSRSVIRIRLTKAKGFYFLYVCKNII